MVNLFYIMLLVFVMTDVYYLVNRRRMSMNFRHKDVMSVRSADLLYYFLKTISSAWPFIGIFTEYNGYFLAVLILWLLKFVSYHLSSRFYTVYVYAVPLIVSAIYAFVFVCWLRH